VVGGQRQNCGGFRSYFKTIKDQLVAWSGRVVEIRKEHGDEAI
jgi:hypothetical protein